MVARLIASVSGGGGKGAATLNPNGSTQCEAMADLAMSDWWRSAPIPAARVWSDAGATRLEINPAALAWARHVKLDDAGWQALAQRQLARGLDGDEDLSLGAVAASAGCRTVMLGDGCLLWITPDQTRLSRMVPHAEQVDLMTRHGRMGLVVRNLETGEGQWDRHVFQIFGLPPAPVPPDFTQAINFIHAEDRGPFLQAHNVRTLTPGTHSIRFRIHRPDGEVRYLNSLYAIRPALNAGGRLLVSLLMDETESVLHDRAQRENRSTLATAVALAGVSVWRSDPVADRIEFNDAGLRMLGLDEHTGPVSLRSVREMVHPDDLDAVVHASEEALAHRHVVDVMARYRKPEGGWRHLLTRRFAACDEAGRVVGLNGISLDVTELAQVRSLSSALLDRICLVTDAIGVGFWWRDLDLGRLEWDEHMFRLHFRDPGMGAPSLDEFLERHVHPDDRVMMRERQARHIAEWPTASELIFRILTPEGRTRWIQSWTRRLKRDGHRLSFGLHVDVTDRREAELRLEQERERDRYAIEAARVGVWEWPLDGRPVYWNAASYALHGFQVGDSRPIEVLQALACTVASLHRAQALRRACIEGQAEYRLEFEVNLPEGGERWLMATGQLLRDELGRPRALTGVTVDVTERRAAERLARERDRAEQANAAKSELMARVSHELRTPMNAVLGFAELMALDSLSASQQERLTRIRSAGSHLLALIDDLLDLAQSEAQRRLAPLEVVPLSELFQEARHWVQPLARSGEVRLNWPSPSQLVGAAVMAERRRLGQVITNLLTNAIKYNRHGGQVWVAVEAADLAGQHTWALTVRDNGRGMTSAQQARLFEPFNRLGMEREGIPGTGLGLSISRQLVQDMGGTLQVRSLAGQGSVFTVHLARSQPASANLRAGTSLAEAPPLAMPQTGGHAVRVLYIEDNPVNEMLVSQILAQQPAYVLRTAADGCSGLAEARAWQPQIVLLDLQLPDLTGQEVLARLRQEPAMEGARYVALSANAMSVDIEEALARGFDAYWTKPLDVARFLSNMDAMAAELRG